MDTYVGMESSGADRSGCSTGSIGHLPRATPAHRHRSAFAFGHERDRAEAQDNRTGKNGRGKEGRGVGESDGLTNAAA